MVGAFSKARRACLLGALALIAAGPAPPRAQETAPAPADAERERLESVRREIARLQAALDAASREEKSLLGDLHGLELELELHRRQVQLLESEMGGCREAIARETLQSGQLRGRLGRERELLARRVRALYVSGPLRLERAVLTARDPGEAAEAYRLTDHLVRSDGRRIEGIRTDLADLQESLEALEREKSRLAFLRSQEITRRRELEGARDNRARLLGGIRQQTEERRAALAEMVATERDLQRLVQALASGGVVRPEWKVGFERFRGLLPWPGAGKVLVPFGAQKSSRFDTKVPHPGIDLAIAVGDPIRAVFDGTVAFSDWFKGFGNLLILDHGGGFMTVYAHASERLVSQGSEVVGGQIVARGGDSGSLDGPKLYFEIWRDGKPEDPLVWLTRR
jgi:septal ring factor EnvC (AmiA/AmiB activator)